MDAAVSVLSKPAHGGSTPPKWQFLGLASVFDVDPFTEITPAGSRDGDLVRRPVPPATPACRWYFLDSLDRQHVQPDLHAAVGELAREIEAGQLGSTRLIVTGYPVDFFPPAVLDVLEEETISEIAAPEVRAFFQNVARDVGRQVSHAQLDDLVSQVTVNAVGLATMGKSAMVARAFFEGPRDGRGSIIRCRWAGGKRRLAISAYAPHCCPTSSCRG